MLKVNVGLSRKLSRDYNSTGFSLNLEGELCAGMDDPVVVIERIKEFYDLAEEALSQQIERYETDSAIGSRDEPHSDRSNGHSNPSSQSQINSQASSPNGQSNHQGNSQPPDREPATNKQVQFLLNLGKRQGMNHPQLENRIEGLLGRRVGLYDLSKKEAGTVIEALNQLTTSNGNSHGNGQSRR